VRTGSVKVKASWDTVAYSFITVLDPRGTIQRKLHKPKNSLVVFRHLILTAKSVLLVQMILE